MGEEKEEPQPDKYLSSINFANGTSFNVTYNLFYSADKKSGSTLKTFQVQHLIPNLSNYPTKQTITYYSSSEVRTLQFTYE